MRHCLCLLCCIIRREEERSMIRVLQMGNSGLLFIRRMNRVLNAWIREMCRVMKGLNERIDESVLSH